MSKKGVVATKLYSSSDVLKMQEKIKTLQMALAQINIRVLFARDVLEHTADEVKKRGKLTPKLANDLGQQIHTMDNILRSILGMDDKIAAEYRRQYVTAEFDQAVAETANEIAPLIEVPNMAVIPKKFTLEN